MIQVNNLVKLFGERQAVRGVSFEVDKGEVLGFLGPNGAGKTTTMRMITGYLPPSSGTAVVEGHDILATPIEARRCIGYLPESAPMYSEMIVRDFLRFIAEIRGFTGSERDKRVDEVVERTFLSNVQEQSIDTLSKGYRQRTAFAQAILHDPPVLIMDEPTEGLDPNQKQVVRSMIRQMSQDKVIILSTHVLEEVEAICNRVVIISNGALVADSTPAELKSRSSQYHAVTVELPADSGADSAAFKAIEGVQRVQALESGEGTVAFRLYPQPNRVIINDVLAGIQARGWAVDAVRTEEGRLDEVFRQLTITEDVVKDAGKKTEEAAA